MNTADGSDFKNEAKAALLRFMRSRNLSANELARRAGFSPSAIYNLEAGRSKAPSNRLLEKIAKSEGVTISDILAHGADQPVLTIRHVVVSGARIITSTANMTVTGPNLADPAVQLEVAVVSGDAMHPIPAGWLLSFASNPEAPNDLIGDLAVLRTHGASDTMIGRLFPSCKNWHFNIEPWHGSVIKDETIVDAHRILFIQSPQ